MRWTRANDENGYCRLDIEAPWGEIAEDFHDVAARYAKVRMPGFRPGKAPLGVTEQRFGKKIADETGVRVVQRLGREAVRESGVEALGPLEAFEIACAKGQPLRAKIRYLPLPEIRLPDLAGLAGDDRGASPLDRISRRLLELVPFEIPDALVRKELDFEGAGDTPPGSEEWAAAADRIRLLVILKKIARQEGVEVDEADVQERIARKAEEFGTTLPALRAELEKGGGIARLKDMLLAESTLEYLVELARS